MLLLSEILLFVVVVVLFLASRRPDTFRIVRSTHVPASSERVYALVQDFHQWKQWSPWEHIDPTMQRTYSGADAGVGAVYAWSGTGKVGAGRMTITHVTPERQITIQLDFIRPFEAHNVAEFTFTPDNNGTQVQWTMHGPSPFISKLFGLFVNFDQMVGKDFERGLQQLSTAAQRA